MLGDERRKHDEHQALGHATPHVSASVLIQPEKNVREKQENGGLSLQKH